MPMNDGVLNRLPEFALACACCRWPPSSERTETIQASAALVTDWNRFLRIVNCHRIAGLVHHALASSEIDVPSHVADGLALSAGQIARQNLAMAAESARLQEIFDDAQIPVVFVKGVSLAQLAYGSLSLKHGKDIDLLVTPSAILTSLRLLEQEGYALSHPAAHLGQAQRNAVIRYAKEFGLLRQRDNSEVELRWRLTDNPLLLTGIDANSPTQEVPLGGGCGVRTLRNGDLFAYICAHGARHAWSRLKWLVDLNAFIAGMSDDDIERLYRNAAARGAGLCAGQALLLREALLGRSPPPALAAELRHSRRIKRLVALGTDAMVGSDAETEIYDRPFATTRIALGGFGLGRGAKYYWRQCHVAFVNLEDVIGFRLPERLHFIYPVLRLPLWLWRRIIYRGRNRGRSHGSQPAGKGSLSSNLMGEIIRRQPIAEPHLPRDATRQTSHPEGAAERPGLRAL
ncbi:MAG: nucleotidyltransferase domain-containing protein [Stellaceae bacterium]